MVAKISDGVSAHVAKSVAATGLGATDRSNTLMVKDSKTI